MQQMPFGVRVKPDLLYRAAAKGDVDEVTKSMESSWPPAAVLNEALAKACGSGQLQAATVLILHGAAIEPPAYTESLPPLHAACENGHVAVARFLLQRGASVDRAGAEGDTALGRAAFAGLEGVVKLLLEYRASLMASNEGGQLGDVTPLERAITGNDPNAHSSKAWSMGNWTECIALLEQAQESVQVSDQVWTAQSHWVRVREHVFRVRPYALHWLREWEASRRARGLLVPTAATQWAVSVQESAPELGEGEFLQQRAKQLPGKIASENERSGSANDDGKERTEESARFPPVDVAVPRLPLIDPLTSEQLLDAQHLDSEREEEEDWEGSDESCLSLIAEEDEEQMYDQDGNDLGAEEAMAAAQAAADAARCSNQSTPPTTPPKSPVVPYLPLKDVSALPLDDDDLSIPASNDADGEHVGRQRSLSQRSEGGSGSGSGIE